MIEGNRVTRIPSEFKSSVRSAKSQTRRGLVWAIGGAALTLLGLNAFNDIYDTQAKLTANECAPGQATTTIGIQVEQGVEINLDGRGIESPISYANGYFGLGGWSTQGPIFRGRPIDNSQSPTKTIKIEQVLPVLKPLGPNQLGLTVACRRGSSNPSTTTVQGTSK